MTTPTAILPPLAAPTTQPPSPPHLPSMITYSPNPLPQKPHNQPPPNFLLRQPLRPPPSLLTMTPNPQTPPKIIKLPPIRLDTPATTLTTNSQQNTPTSSTPTSTLTYTPTDYLHHHQQQQQLTQSPSTYSPCSILPTNPASNTMIAQGIPNYQKNLQESIVMHNNNRVKTQKEIDDDYEHNLQQERRQKKLDQQKQKRNLKRIQELKQAMSNEKMMKGGSNGGVVSGGVGKRYPCERCDKSFTRKSDARKHVRVVHDRLKIFVCEVCDKKFARKDYLGKHLKSVHCEGNSKGSKFMNKKKSGKNGVARGDKRCGGSIQPKNFVDGVGEICERTDCGYNGNLGPGGFVVPVDQYGGSCYGQQMQGGIARVSMTSTSATPPLPAQMPMNIMASNPSFNQQYQYSYQPHYQQAPWQYGAPLPSPPLSPANASVLSPQSYYHQQAYHQYTPLTYQ